MPFCGMIMILRNVVFSRSDDDLKNDDILRDDNVLRDANVFRDDILSDVMF